MTLKSDKVILIIAASGILNLVVGFSLVGGHLVYVCFYDLFEASLIHLVIASAGILGSSCVQIDRWNHGLSSIGPSRARLLLL